MFAIDNMFDPVWRISNVISALLVLNTFSNVILERTLISLCNPKCSVAYDHLTSQLDITVQHNSCAAVVNEGSKTKVYNM